MKDYLQRDLISGVTYKISNRHILIQNDNTCWANISVPILIDKDYMLDLYKEIRIIAKQNDVKISVSNHYKRKIIERYNEYVEIFNNSVDLFEKMKDIALQIEERGLHLGVSDDSLMKDFSDLKEKYFQLTVYASIENEAYRVITSIYKYLVCLKLELSSDKDFSYRLSKIYL